MSLIDELLEQDLTPQEFFEMTKQMAELELGHVPTFPQMYFVFKHLLDIDPEQVRLAGFSKRRYKVKVQRHPDEVGTVVVRKFDSTQRKIVRDVWHLLPESLKIRE